VLAVARLLRQEVPARQRARQLGDAVATLTAAIIFDFVFTDRILNFRKTTSSRN